MGKSRLIDLVHRLHKQHPVDRIYTQSPCPSCGEPSVGGDLCADCLVREIETVVGDTYHPDRYRTQTALLQYHLREMLRLVERSDADTAPANADMSAIRRNWAHRWGQEDQT